MCANPKEKACAFVVMAALVCSMALPMVSTPVHGDLNGDHACNVSDLQKLVSQILTNDRKALVPLSDLNADGRVDILDLQAILAETQQGSPRPASSPKDPQPQAILPEYNDKVLFTAGTVIADGWTHEEALPSRLLCLRDQKWMDRLQRPERYTFSLIPHAPPPSV